MPELPEVETSRRGIAPHIQGRAIERLLVRQPKLRWPVPAGLESQVEGQLVEGVGRRAKYLLLHLPTGVLLIHLGMSGSLRILSRGVPPGAHDHFDLIFRDCCLRYRDPRRFGALLWSPGFAEDHPLLRGLGPEPLESGFNGEYLYQVSRGRRQAVKPFIMDGRVVVGVGNIYANEALFASGIHPHRPCRRISLTRYRHLARKIQSILTEAIQDGGTTLRDFSREDGRPGYFEQRLRVYGRSGQPCISCGRLLRQIRIGQRSSYFCPGCQR